MTNTKSIVTGVLLLDKPKGISSQQALSKAKHLLKSPIHDSKKAGHTGTLDPMATGLLPICFGDATRFSSFGLDADKGYTAIVQLGSATDTGDQEGQVIDTKPVPALDDDGLQKVVQSFLGKQSQIPPMYSALKKDGKKLYEYARAGIEIERMARDIEILALSLRLQSPISLALDVVCSKGTYVRTLGEDIAKALGTVGHLTALRRTSTGGFDIKDAISLDELEALDLQARLDCLRPADCLLTHLPSLDVSDDVAGRFKLGQRLHIRQINPNVTDIGLVRLYCNGVFLGLAEIEQNGRVQPKKLCQF